MGLSLEQEGFYIRLCSYVYETGLRLPTNDSAAAKFMGLHTNAYRKIRNQLSAIGKVILREDGWTVARAEKELSAARGSSEAGRSSHPDAGRNTSPDTVGDSPPETPTDSGGVFSQNTNEHNSAPLEPIAVANSQKDSVGASAPPAPPKGPSKVECLEAFTAYNETAKRCAIPQAAKFTPDRHRKIAARLKDYGMNGWKQALANIERSSWLTGENSRQWRADLDWLLSPEKFSKVHDGGYGNGRHAKAAPPIRKVYDQHAQAAAFQAAAAQMLLEDGVVI
jgi:uncharacterized protein YdaU (DUF1376 family)